MKKLLLPLLMISLMVSCGAKKSLYYWSTYEKESYNYLKKSDEKSQVALGLTYQKIIDNYKTKPGTRKEVPPGVYADYGFLLIKMNKIEEGKKLLAMEKSLYPESAVFINRILKMIE